MLRFSPKPKPSTNNHFSPGLHVCSGKGATLTLQTVPVRLLLSWCGAKPRVQVQTLQKQTPSECQATAQW